jgi:hypothetical protein
MPSLAHTQLMQTSHTPQNPLYSSISHQQEGVLQQLCGRVPLICVTHTAGNEPRRLLVNNLHSTQHGTAQHTTTHHG